VNVLSEVAHAAARVAVRARIVQALVESGSVSGAAVALRMDRANLRRVMRALDVPTPKWPREKGQKP
jgi:transcriptional regulator with GAF, ATPase, and Fis domain